MEKNDKIFIAGITGMVGSNLKDALIANGYANVFGFASTKLNLLDTQAVNRFFAEEKPKFVVLAAGKTGGIEANSTLRAEFIYENIKITFNVINASKDHGVRKLIFIGSSAAYPKFSEQPIKEESLLTGELEYANEPYAIAKIAAIKLCEYYYRAYGSNFYTIMSANLYGYNDHFNETNAHVLPALVYKFHKAKQENKEKVIIWGSGKPMREFLFMTDFADAIIFLLNNVNASEIYNDNISVLNVGTGHEETIFNLAHIIADIVSFKGNLVLDSSKPDGSPRKLLDVTRINGLGWKSKIALKEGIKLTYKWYLEKIFHNT